MEKDVRRFFSKHTSMSMIKADGTLKCEQDIVDVQNMIDSGEFQDMEFDLDDYRRGLAYFFGIGEIRDDEAGLRYLKLAADEGNIDAMNMYGYACYHTSLGSKDMPEKQQWYEKQAVKWFAEAASMGQVEAIFNLAVCMLEGKGTDLDEKEGLRFIETAMKKGHPRASLYLEDYKTKKGEGLSLPRECSREEAFALISDEMKKEIEKSGLTDIYVTGLFNDIFLEKGYKWVKNPALGWVCSKDEGKTYLIAEGELAEMNNYFVN